MLYAGLDLSRKRLDFHLLDAEGGTIEVGAAASDVDGLHGLTERLDRQGESIRAAIESMNGARFMHDQLERAGWQVEIADAQKVKGWRRWPARPIVACACGRGVRKFGHPSRVLVMRPLRTRG
jgi:transposase